MNDPGSIVDSIFLIYSGAAVLAAIALYTRQPLLVAYIATGCLLGPYGFGLVADPQLLAEMAEIGIVFLLYLVGLDLQPSKLKNMLGKGLITALSSSLIFFLAGMGLMKAFGYSNVEAAITGIAICFSSTIIGVKLLPTTVLHHRHVGEIVVSLLLIQDLLAILALIVLAAPAGDVSTTMLGLGKIILSLPVLVAACFFAVRFVLLPLLAKFDVFQEFIFLLALGWCLGIAHAAALLGLSLEIGGFVAGVSLATSPIAQYIAQSLKPLRDFFLVLFFFSVGAGLNLTLLMEVWLPTLILALLVVAIKPLVYQWLLRWQDERPETATEVSFRLGQASEFSLLVSYVAVTSGLLAAEAAHVIQGATVLSLILSTYLVIFRFPSPIAVSAALRKN